MADISRNEIRRIIARYPRWYQNIRFGFLLETNSPIRSIAKDILRITTKNDTIISSLPDLTGKKVIDIGCNAGLYSLHAGMKGAAHVLGVDRNEMFVAQARDVAEVFRRQGKPVARVEFREVTDINDNLELLADRDVFMACAVLYHLGPLHRLKEGIIASPITMLILQGNTVRMNRLDQKNVPGVEGYESKNQTWGNVVSNVEGMRAFAESMGFRVERVTYPNHQHPVVIATRDLSGPQ